MSERNFDLPVVDDSAFEKSSNYNRRKFWNWRKIKVMGSIATVGVLSAGGYALNNYFQTLIEAKHNTKLQTELETLGFGDRGVTARVYDDGHSVDLGCEGVNMAQADAKDPVLSFSLRQSAGEGLQAYVNVPTLKDNKQRIMEQYKERMVSFATHEDVISYIDGSDRDSWCRSAYSG